MASVRGVASLRHHDHLVLPHEQTGQPRGDLPGRLGDVVDARICAGDLPARRLGAELTGAEILRRPETEDMLLRIRLAALPPTVAGLPAVLYGANFEVDGVLHEVRALRATTDDPLGGPHIALYWCGPVCTRIVTLPGAFGTTGPLLISVPEELLGMVGGPALGAPRVEVGVAPASTRQYGGKAVKWLGDGVMFYFPEPALGVLATLEMVERVAGADLPPAHVGLHAGPVVLQDGDYFGRTVNTAARIAEYARPGEVVVSQEVVDTAEGNAVAFSKIGPVELKGVAGILNLYAARRRE